MDVENRNHKFKQSQNNDGSGKVKILGTEELQYVRRLWMFEGKVLEQRLFYQLLRIVESHVCI